MSSLSIFSTAPTTGQAVTMTSGEIADLTGKEHKNVIRDIRAMLEELKGDGSDLSHVQEVKDMRGYTACFKLPKRETLILVSGYSTELRARIIDRWQALEAKVSQPQPVALTQAEQDIRIAVMLADALNVAPSGRITMLGVALQHSAPHMLPALPSYAVDAPPSLIAQGSSLPTAAVTDLLRLHDHTISALRFNQMLERFGLLAKIERRSSNGGAKSFWVVTEPGLEYGKNITSQHSPRETQPHWYVDRFCDLLELIKGDGK